MRLRREHHRVRTSRAGAIGTAFALGALVVTVAFVLVSSQPAEAGIRVDAGPAVLGWQAFTNAPPFAPGAMFLLTDGTVMVQALASGAGSPDWWRLTPDSTGSYVDGTWSRLASLPAYYGPGAYASAVLPDGRLAVEGGEFNNGAGALTNLGAIYDPLTNTWTMVSPPKGGTGEWSRIGDTPSEVMADGRWIVSGLFTDAAILDPANLTWTTTGLAGKTNGTDEAGFTLLPNGKILSVDVIPPACTTRTTEIFDPATLEWSSAGLVPAPLVECGDISEIGPQLLMYGGKVFVEGATPATALYDVTTGTWSAAPNFPVVGSDQQDASDAGSALLPNGDVFLLSRTGEIQVNGGMPSHFFLFDGTNFTQAPEYPTSTQGGLGYMLLLPTGQVLYNGWPAGLRVFTDPGTPDPAWAPTLTIVPGRLAAGVTYQLVGRQLNGLSEGAAFGDDYQSSTDFPLVQITNDGTGAVAYARTFGMTNRSIAPAAPSCTSFTVPSGIAAGASELRVIANGIASAPVPVTVGAGGSTQHACPNFTLSLVKAGSGSGTVASVQAGIDCGATCSRAYPNGTIVTLTATPTAGSTFAGWSGGACSGTGACTITVSADTPVTATFALAPETLTVSKSGSGAGAVTSSPPGIDCGSGCSHAFDYGSAVTLTATAEHGSSFAGWSGGGCSGAGACVVTLSSNTKVTANFTGPQTLTISRMGDGAGTVTSSPAGISCGTGCTHAFDYGGSVTLVASPARGSSFAGWAGDCTGKAGCALRMTAARFVRASFVKDCVVPKLGGKSLRAAKRALMTHDCSVGTIERAFSNSVRKGRVISQRPKPRKLLGHGAKVRLTISKGPKP